MERKAAIVRFWFFAAAVALLGCWEPAMWFGVVPLFFMSNCPCCGLSCATFEDEFDRADAADPGSDWSVQAGSFPIVSNTLSATAGAARDRVWLASQPAGGRITSEIQADTDGDIVGILIGYTDSNNYTAALLKFGTGSEVRIKQVSGGVTTTNTESYTLALDTPYKVVVHSHVSGVPRKSILINNTLALISNLSTAGTAHFGAFIETLTGTATWNYFYVQETSLDNALCEKHVACSGGDVVGDVDFELVMSGWSDSANCPGSVSPTCSVLNSTFTGTFQPAIGYIASLCSVVLTASHPAACWFTELKGITVNRDFDNSTTYGGNGKIYLVVVVNIPKNNGFGGNAGGEVVFRKEITEADCDTELGLGVHTLDHYTTIGTPPCTPPATISLELFQ